MDILHVLVVFLSIVAFAGIGALVYVFRGAGGRNAGFRGLMPSANPASASHDDSDVLDVDLIKQRSGASKVKKTEEDTQAKLFRAGYFSPQDRRRFFYFQIITPCITGPLIGGLGLAYLSPTLGTAFAVVGFFVGYAYPLSWLEKKIRIRQEDTLYFLPLVIEQISIGVSSSLDIGPCIAQLLEMADQRDAHNPVTEMFISVEKLMRSGLNLEESLIEVAEANGQTEVKHAFLFLGQCAKHGGEISKQLQELADAVMVQRQVYIEGRIAALPVKATGPLAVVFAGFFALLFAGLMVRLVEAFGGGVGTT